MSKEPKTIGELFFYMEGEFSAIRTEIDNMKNYVRWVCGVMLGIPMTIFGIIKIVNAL